MITRRSLLRAGMGAAAVAAVGAAPAKAVAGSPDWAALRASLTGTLFLPADAGYPVAKEVQYAQYQDLDPAAVAFCQTAADVQKCVRFARSNGIKATPRSGGHSLGGYSLSDGLVVDVSKLLSVRAAGQSVLVGAGAEQIDLLAGLNAAGLSAAGLALPQAPEPTVGTAGYVQGGGIGFESRMFGLMSDLLLSADLVLADGTGVHCSADQNADLFWALRGGGGGNFGIATQFEFRPVPMPRMANFVLTWPWADIHDVQQAWQHWMINGSRDISGSLLIILGNLPGSASSGPAVPQVNLVGAALTDLDRANSELDALVSAAGSQPTFRSVTAFDRNAGMLNLFNCGSLTTSQCHRTGSTPDGELPPFNFTIERNRLFGQGLSPDALDQVTSTYVNGFQAGQIRLLEFVALGGAVNDVSRTATAYLHRTSQFFIRTGFGLPTATPPAADIAAGRSWIDGLFGVIDKYSNSESYQNFIDPSLAQWPVAYYGENYPRLRQVKRHYDPGNFFQFAQSIRP